MSTAYAVAAVTAVLRDRIRSRLVQAGVGAVTGSVEVSAIAPDHVDVGAAEPSRLDLFLHHVMLNQGWRNEGQPERDSNGRRLSAPPLGLDLHYLLTAYGAEPYHAEILLGHASQELHENPVLTRDQVRAALAPAVPDSTLPALVASSALADQVEGLRIVLTMVPPDEMSRLWTALEAHYRPTISFQVGVVLIDNEAASTPSLPVLLRGPAVEPFRRPLVDAVENAADAAEPVLAASTIRLRGRRLGASGTTVRVGDQVATPAESGDTELTVDLGALATPPSAGLVPVQVLQSVDLGDPPVPHAALASEPVGLVLRPAATFTRAVTSTVVVDGENVHDGTITATVDPPVLRRQRVTVLLNERNAPATRPARSFAFSAPDGNGVPATTPSTTAVTVEFAGVP
jgi:Pvc16 N-terminal domain